MMDSVLRFDEERLLLVEGRDEENLFEAFLRHLGIVGIRILSYRGKNNLQNRLRVYVDAPGFDQVRSIGIVQDADNSGAQAALQSVQSSLRNAGLPSPQTFLTPVGDLPRVSVFIMPDNSGSGALEDLCLKALDDDPARDCVDDFLQCVKGSVTAPPQNTSKAKMHAFLASRQDPELRLGEAAQRGYIPWGHPSFAPLTEFLRSF
jgi:hypothetical protein